MKAVVLAAGLGTRLRPLTYTTPKALLGLGEKTVIEHIIGWLKSHGVDEILIAIHYLGRMIKSYLGDGEWLGVKIQYYSYPPSGTAGQLFPLKDKIKKTFVIVYSDTITDLNLTEMLRFHRKMNSIFTLATAPIELKLPYGTVETKKDGRILAWIEKPKIKRDVVIGVFISEPEILKYVPPNPTPMNKFVEKLVNEKFPVYVYRSQAKFYDVGTYEDYVKLSDIYSKPFKKI